MKRATKERENEARQAKERILVKTRQHWISLGMIREYDAHLMGTVEPPYHPRIERLREMCRICRIKLPNTTRTSAFGQRKNELRDLQELEETTRDDDIKRAIHYMIGVTMEALNLNFKRDELPGLFETGNNGKKKKSDGEKVDFQRAGRESNKRMGTNAIPIPRTRKQRSRDFHYAFFVPDINTEKHKPNRPEKKI